jgi:hypothetical protein
VKLFTFEKNTCMFSRPAVTYLKCKRALYLKLLVFLGMLSWPVFTGCSGNRIESLQDTTTDSIAAAAAKSDSIAAAIALRDSLMRAAAKDSAAKAEKEKAFLDSVRKAGTGRPKPDVMTDRPQTKYGVPVNQYKPVNAVTKYGVPSDFRD